MLGVAVLPDLSLSLALAAAQICSRESSFSIQWSEDEMMDVRYLGVPIGSFCLSGGIFCLAMDNDGGFCSKFLRTSSKVDAVGCA